MTHPASAASDYRVFGLRIRSEIPLPELFPATGDGAPDVTIRRTELSAAGVEPGLQAHDDALLLAVPDVARYRIEGGREILVDADPGVPERNLRLYLLGSAFGALLHQRGLLPLHANAVEIDGKAVAFVGQSGAGKSTLAAWFLDHGFRIIADDVCVVRFDRRGRAIAQPGLPRLRLWDEALQATGRNAADFSRSYVGEKGLTKYDVPIGPHTAADRELPLAAVYLLERGERMQVRPVAGIEAAEAVFAHTYRGAFVSAAKSEHSHWEACVQLVRGTRLFLVTRAWGLDQLNDQGGVLLHRIRNLDSAFSGTI